MDYEILKITTVDPVTGEQVGETYYGVGAFDESGYAITRSSQSIEELREDVGDLEDEDALERHVSEHHPHW